jgi:GxxExxY protein
MKTREELDRLTGAILDASISVHKEMGPGLLESVYQTCLADELDQRSIAIQSMVPVPLIYKGRILNKDYVIDLLVEDEVILELKSVEGILPVHKAQLISYLRLANKKIGFLINFNTPLLKDGFHRFVNNL